jgi:6-pyruvoyltetrahydropterin/6-carboxytetrahydropterin synthase
MKITATRRVQFAIGHRVHGHEGKCRHLHGHNFVFHLTAEADELDSVGRVVDFGVLKALVGGWIEAAWDHGFVLWVEDTEGLKAMTQVAGQKFYLLPYNPTAENLAMHILRTVGPYALKETGVRLVRVRVDETENGSAEAAL